MPNTQIEIAQAFEPLFTSDFLDFVLSGGRTSGKSKQSATLSGIQTAVKPNEDIFVHYSAIELDGYKTLNEGQVVEFKLIETSKGYQAINVKLIPQIATIN